MAAMLIETETTPNPATLKFLPGRPVIEAGPPRDFADADEATASPLAEALFGLGDVAGAVDQPTAPSAWSRHLFGR